jgi:hypothetical protein
MSAAVGPLMPQFVVAASALSLLCLLTLHMVSPEYQPSWRMISEYAMGRHKWLITAFFLLWGVSSILLSLVLWNAVTTGWGRLGVVLLLVSGLGEFMGGLFDVKHPWHGIAFALGVPSLAAASLLIGYDLVDVDPWSSHRGTILIATHATWISLVLMAIAMAVMFAGFKKAGIPMDANAPAPERVPDGVVALGGYANRLLVLCYVGWLIVMAVAAA